MRIDAKKISLVYDINKDELTYAFRDIDFGLSHKIVGITGPSGSGKSSLLYVLAGLKRATSGTVYYDDMDIEAYSPEQMARIRKTRFGFIFQRNFLIEYLSVMDNVLSAVNENGAGFRKKAQELLDRLNIGHLAGRKPSQLSGGQRQRASIARALINDPEIIFADEPTASLDHRNARDVMDVIEEYRKKAAVLITTHDRSILENADSVVEIWDGHIK